ncbi:MAG: hypothetical protein DMF34_06725, partial [Verrucomicrobia bacterium]
DKRKNIVPRRLWAALNLKRPAVGVFRHPKRHMYQVTYRDRDGRLRTRAFALANPSFGGSAFWLEHGTTAT